MSPSLDVLEGGLSTTVQDLGRFGHQAIGLPVAGALDPIGLRFANVLVGNAEGAGALELRLTGPRFRVQAESVRLALSDDAATLAIDGEITPPGRSVTARCGSEVAIGPLRGASCCYLAIEGGFDLPAPFGSQSTYAPAALGGFRGRALRSGDPLPLRRAAASARAERVAPEPRPDSGDAPFTVVLGPQESAFTDEALATLVEAAFQIGHESSRMGARLEGPALGHRAAADIASDGVTAGAIQVPGSGQPIVLLADRQTTGGYAKIGVVASFDLPRLARLQPGSLLRFRVVDQEAAEDQARETEKRVRAALAAIRDEDGDLEAKLWRANLISGAISE